jgi:hypothetical protein
MPRHLLILSALMVGSASPVAAQQPTPPSCDSPDHRAFDYWVGEWVVSDTTGRHIANSSITSVSRGCAIAEHWRPLRGAEGRSLSWFEPKDGRWHQQWIGGDGWIARFAGGVTDGELTMTEAAHPATAAPPIARMRWMRVGADTVRQVMWQSRDAGGTWTPAFVGVYVRTTQ